MLPRLMLLGILLLPACTTVEADYGSVPAIVLGDASFFPTIEAHTQAPIVGGNRVEFLLNGEQIFPAMFRAIRSAQRTISYLQYYYEEGAVGRQMAEELAARCRAGVTVNVVLDGVGALTMPNEYYAMMEQAGCKMALYRPLRPWEVRRINNRNHRRVLVVDGRIGFTGGSGIGDKWIGDGRTPKHWRDTDIQVEGPAVHHLQAAFAENWRELARDVLGGPAHFPALSARGSAHVQIVRSSPTDGSYEAYMLFLLTIESAHRSLDITNPYFVPDDRMASALVRAIARGVRVRVLVPGEVDHNIVREASRAQFGRMLLAGIEIHEYKAALLHAKTLVADGVLATVGSTNLDNRSFALNEELNVTVYDRQLAARLAQIFDEDLRHAQRVTYESWKNRGIKARAFELIAAPIKNLL